MEKKQAEKAMDEFFEFCSKWFEKYESDDVILSGIVSIAILDAKNFEVLDAKYDLNMDEEMLDIHIEGIKEAAFIEADLPKEEHNGKLKKFN